MRTPFLAGLKARLRKPGALALLALAATVAATTGTAVAMSRPGSAKASEASEYAAYPALSSTAPSELPLVTTHSEADTGSGPTWPADAPEGAPPGWPVATSIRKVSIDVSGASAWIAEATGGGVCVLLAPHTPVRGVYGVAYSCDPGSEGLARGATVEQADNPTGDGVEFSAGVVPDGVTAVRATFASGRSETIAVSDNAWALEAPETPKTVEPVSTGG